MRSLIEIAEARGWDAITVSGAEEFRRAVWRAGYARGIEVHGYAATELERTEMQRATSRRSQEPPAASNEQPSSSRHERRPDRSDGRLSGRLLEHGAAHYKFDPDGALSYYVKLRTANGDRTLWGVDLERALVESESRVQVGDTVMIENRGAERVKVKVPQRDPSGSLVGERLIETRRNRWLIESPAWFEQRAEAAAALREGRASDVELVRRHKGLANAVTALWLGRQFAERRIEDVDDRERWVAAVRERLAESLERGDTVSVPMLKVHGRARSSADPRDDARLRARARSEPLGRTRESDRDVPPQVLG